MPDQQKIATLLGRTLTPAEIAAFDDYLEIASTRVEDLICISLTDLLTELQVSALPSDLALVVARFFGVISQENQAQPQVQSKRVEDFSVTYNTDADIFGACITQNMPTLAKYSHCGCTIRQGRTLREDARYYDRF